MALPSRSLVAFVRRHALSRLLHARAGLWVNEALEEKLLLQLRPLGVITGAVPGWVRLLPRAAPFLFSGELRRKQLRFMAFGVSRAIAAMQEDRHPVAKLQREVRNGTFCSV